MAIDNQVMAVLNEIPMLVIGGIFTVLWWLLKSKDAAQAKQIEELFTMHHKDVQKLQDLELKIAEKHYDKQALDVKFDKLEKTFSDGFHELGGDFRNLGIKFDNLSTNLMKHMIKEDQR